jgi:hypothetical protein
MPNVGKLRMLCMENVRSIIGFPANVFATSCVEALKTENPDIHGFYVLETAG